MHINHPEKQYTPQQLMEIRRNDYEQLVNSLSDTGSRDEEGKQRQMGVAELTRELFGLADEVVEYQFHDWGGQLKENPSPAKGLCRYAAKQLVLTAEGKIAKCCFDLNGRTALGSIETEDLSEILKRRRHDLITMMLHRRSRIKGCATCEVE